QDGRCASGTPRAAISGRGCTDCPAKPAVGAVTGRNFNADFRWLSAAAYRSGLLEPLVRAASDIGHYHHRGPPERELSGADPVALPAGLDLAHQRLGAERV